MGLRKKFVKTALAAGLCAGVFQAASCSVSPELLQALVAAVSSQVKQGNFDFSGHFGGFGAGHNQSEGSPLGADGPAAHEDDD